MCGRYKMSTKSAAIMEVFGIDAPTDYDPPVRFNVAPTDAVPVVVRDEDGKRSLKPMRWGLIPFWAEDKSIGARMINARVETLKQKPAFRESLEKRPISSTIAARNEPVTFGPAPSHVRSQRSAPPCGPAGEPR